LVVIRQIEIFVLCVANSAWIKT